jgi:hypothetical protein
MQGIRRSARAATAGSVLYSAQLYLNSKRFSVLDEHARDEAAQWSEATGVRIPALTGARGVISVGLVGAVFGLGYTRTAHLFRWPAPAAGAGYGLGFWSLYQAVGWAVSTDGDPPSTRQAPRGTWVYGIIGFGVGLLTDGVARPRRRQHSAC